MQRKFLMIFCLGLFFILNNSVLTAQKTTPTTTPIPPPFKRPNVKTYWGSTANGTLELSVDSASKLINQPLRIIDDKNVGYLISSYQFAYKRIGLTEDEVTGKISSQSEIVANRFYNSTLPVVWQSNIKEGLQKGEELYFFDIVVISNSGFRFFAPDLKITLL
jgi:hypothetical protein